MIDAEVYLNLLLTRDYAALGVDADTITPDLDVDELDRLPAVTWNVVGAGQVANGGGLWSFILNMNFFGDGMDEAKASAKTGYDLVHGWDNDPTVTVLPVDGADTWVSALADQDIPTRLGRAVIDGRNVVQYAGSFAIDLRQN